MAESLTDILALLQLDEVGPGTFVGPQPPPTEFRTRVFGGQVAAQALIAAGRTAGGRLPHSLHAYFLRLGDPMKPLRYQITNLRDGGTFSAREISVDQDGVVIFEALASFVDDVAGPDYHQQLPDVAPPESLSPLAEQMAAYADEIDGFWVRPRAFELRYVDTPPRLAVDLPGPFAPVSQIWLHINGEPPTDPLTALALVTYISDWTVLDPVVLAVRRSPLEIMGSLDHSMWFHRPPDFSDWLLYDQRTPSGVGGRGLANGAIYNRNGQLVCTVAQEGYLGRG